MYYIFLKTEEYFSKSESTGPSEHILTSRVDNGDTLTVRMMTDDGRGDNGEYTLAAAMRGNVIGPVVRDANDTLYYSSDSSAEDMNIFFKLVGPEKYANVAKSPHNIGEYDAHTADFNKTADGRYTFRGIDLNGTDGRIHYTGGPFYGPFGVTGLGNSNANDETNRSAQVNPNYDKDTNNHFNEDYDLRREFDEYSSNERHPCGDPGRGRRGQRGQTDG